MSGDALAAYWTKVMRCAPLTTSLMRFVALATSYVGFCAALCAPADAAPLRILIVDATHLQEAMPLYAQIDRQAAALADTREHPAAAVRMAADLRKSEVLTDLPEVIAEIATAAGADLVIDRELARRIGEGGAQDVTAAVQQALEVRYSERPLEIVP